MSHIFRNLSVKSMQGCVNIQIYKWVFYWSYMVPSLFWHSEKTIRSG